jgi:TDG/mug DNA glycosylase family protein
MESLQVRKSGLPPVVDENAEILILGTLPSDMSIDAEQYYANPSNDFWRLVAAALNQPFDGLSYESKVELLRASRIGLWDAIQTCVRPGSTDSDITEHELNDFGTLKSIASNIRLICFNGRKAALAEESLHLLGYETRLSPSSSGANRRVQKGRRVSWKASIHFVATDFDNMFPPP